MEWTEMLEKIYLALSRIIDGLVKLFNGGFDTDAE